MKRQVYLDHAATSPLLPEVREAMQPAFGPLFGNPSSLHARGREAGAAIEDARRRIRESLGASRGRLVLTGSGSEADNLAIFGFARRHPGGTIVTSSIEHKAVIEPTRALADEGYDIRVAPVDDTGTVDTTALDQQVPRDGRPVLVSVMWANNETGVVQPIEEIATLCVRHGALLHSDAVQAFGKLPISLGDVPVHMVSLSAHKLGGPKGVGALYLRDEIELEPLVYGGGQESGLRSGTHNVAGITGFAAAAGCAVDRVSERSSRWARLRERLGNGIRKAIPELEINGGEAERRLPHILNVSVPDVDIEGLITALDLEGVCASTGSACTTGSVEPSHVLLAMGREGDRARNSLRFSLGWDTEEDDIDYVIDLLPTIVGRVREYAASAKTRTVQDR